MSRFFAASYEYDSASSSSEEDLLSSSEEELLSSSSLSEEESDDSFFNDSESESDFDSDDSDAKPYGPDWFKKQEFRRGGGGGNKFLKGASYSDSDESDEASKKVVKSAKEKLLDEMQTSSGKIDAAELTNDWITILNEFDSVTRLLTRAQQQNFGTPNIFVKVVAQVEDAVAASQEEINNKAVAKAFNTAKQRVKKISREHQTLLAKYREDPESFEKETSVEVDATPELAQFAVGKKTTDLSSIATTSSETGFFPALSIVLDSRGKKNIDQQALAQSMDDLLQTTKTPYEKIIAYLTLIPIRLDSSTNLSYQPIDQWKATYNDVSSLLSILDENINTYQVSELAPFNDSLENEPEANEKGVKTILGSILSFVDRLDDEFTKSLLNTDPHSSDYLIRLRDEQAIYNLILRTQLYLEATLPEDRQIDLLSRIFVRRLNHIYYKSNELIRIMEVAAWKVAPSSYTSKLTPYDGAVSDSYLSGVISTLTDALSKQQNQSLRKRAVLYNVYYTALNKEFQVAKDMLIESKVQSFINKSDPSLQILFNRVVVQLGLSAFKLCLIEECHQILNDLLASSHLREILGQQTLQRVTAHSNSSNADEREKLCLPFHEHINLDLIDVVFMTCSLLIEIPQMTAFYSGIKIKKIPYSQKSIRRALEHYEKSSFQGPPETLRDYILHSAKEMQKGNWKKSFELLKSIQAWALLPNSASVLDNLAERLQVESLKTYFFTNKRFYSKLSMKKLSDLFNLPEDKIVESLQAVITEYEIDASFNEDKSVLSIAKGAEITKLEEVASKLNKEVKITKERLHPSRGRR
ncbi:hypothetical protein Kpol_513p28 [Vanderwaltozyma polyspora DSM 70294]|uniref:Eukaryotic translation initiation factor 3 subunit C n=1 Tax=Vanderwaltozyma polyspora (strain ATCC 22028 / DSM 70294 / BCRC 21397 / CBS 2163 / NBRC 10782 / NRRL Y-8283 / UCD 57-17) TaxID=436907 RepID=EIF3C_VANPO|nr:uncharacterized protein Kpol_513p28 [Vanderwaltozyma polyspora DSM 70294]A7TML4.1 RecName: Full=Eukaryotic translation initiation factor 3 subunit C; Short=eIF3c; AltName: Full=Eukaryotic translation initiation factor 3 93 kDa subunit homolog; Short=eIF3 p93; AltName: Full=Translation initiation factor eIF3, p93 subunit homolog [Vanderwaltozyma polyspora DSM 70294]EDO16512.1 hypothetical protein Kpol_513p28 [Vanderwaltozyma polyspora DSM 70294]